MSWRLRALRSWLQSFFSAQSQLRRNPPFSPRGITKVPVAASHRPFQRGRGHGSLYGHDAAGRYRRSNAYFEAATGSFSGIFSMPRRLPDRPEHGLVRAMRDRAQRITRFRWLQNALYWMQYVLLTSLLGFPSSTTKASSASTNTAWHPDILAVDGR